MAFYSKKTSYRDVLYDSETEAHTAEYLNKLQEEGKLTKIERQIPFKLPTFQYMLKENPDLKWPGKYIVDFLVTDDKGKQHLLEVKGNCSPRAIRNQGALWKYTLFMYVHGIKVNIVEKKTLEADVERALDDIQDN